MWLELVSPLGRSMLSDDGGGEFRNFDQCPWGIAASVLLLPHSCLIYVFAVLPRGVENSCDGRVDRV